MGTVGNPSVSWRLAPDLAEESLWSVFPRRGLVWEDVRQLPRWDVRTVASVVNQNAEIRGQVMERLLRESTQSFQVPKEFERDRAFLADPADAIYVETMNAYLFRGEGRHPMMTDDRVRNIVVRETDPRQWKTVFALLVGTGRLVSFQDYTYFRKPGAHETDVRMSGNFKDRTRSVVPFDELPEVPMCLAGIIPPRGLAVKSPRVAYYFGATVDTRCKSVEKQYATAYVLEWAHALAAALTLEHVMYNRVWVCEERCVEFLRKFVSFKDFVVDAVGHAVAQVSFRRLVSLLDEARGLSQPYLENRVGCPSALSVSWSVVRPGSSGFVVPVSRSTVRGGTSRRSPLDLVIADPVLRGSSAWEMAPSGEEVRGSGWPVRDVLEVPAGLVNRYYSLKGDPEDELDAMRANLEALSERNAGLREENGELRRSSVVDPLFRRRRGNDGVGRGRAS